jgi:hypothetical protein
MTAFAPFVLAWAHDTGADLAKPTSTAAPSPSATRRVPVALGS